VIGSYTVLTFQLGTEECQNDKSRGDAMADRRAGQASHLWRPVGTGHLCTPRGPILPGDPTVHLSCPSVPGQSRRPPDTSGPQLSISSDKDECLQNWPQGSLPEFH
jgi:hypothetical protein